MAFSSIKHPKLRINVNKIILSFITCIFCTSAVSAGSQAPLLTTLFHGLYVGGSGGGSFSTTTDNATSSVVIVFPQTLINTIVSTTAPSDLVTNLKNNSGIGAVFIGYGLDYKKLFLAAEGFLNYSSYEMSSYGNNGTTQFFSNNNQSYGLASDWQNNTKVSPFQYGLDLRPGFLIKPEMLLYGRVGFARAKITQSSNLTGAVIYSSNVLGPQITDNFPFILGQSATSNKIALRLGGGFEYSFLENWSARMDYIYVNYGKVNSSGIINRSVTGAGWESAGTLRVTNIINLKALTTNTIMLGISHYFA